MKIQKKAIIIILNVVVLLSLLYFQSIRYAKLINYSIENQNHNAALRNVSLLHVFGNDINWIIAIALILLVLNMILLNILNFNDIQHTTTSNFDFFAI